MGQIQGQYFETVFLCPAANALHSCNNSTSKLKAVRFSVMLLQFFTTKRKRENPREREFISLKTRRQAVFEVGTVYLFIIYLIFKDASWEIKFNFRWQNVGIGATIILLHCISRRWSTMPSRCGCYYRLALAYLGIVQDWLHPPHLVTDVMHHPARTVSCPTHPNVCG